MHDDVNTQPRPSLNVVNDPTRFARAHTLSFATMAYHRIRDETSLKTGSLDIVGPARSEYRPVNALSVDMVNRLVTHWIRIACLKPCTLTTGGVDRPLKTHYTTMAASADGKVQMTVPSHMTDIISVLREYQSSGSKQVKVTSHLVYWRWVNDGALFPMSLEMSHLCAAWAGSVLNGERCTQVLACVAETMEMNEPRKACARYGLMWVVGGDWIGSEECSTYRGHTACWHGHDPKGYPCYGPKPDTVVKVTGESPLRKRRFCGARIKLRDISNA